jgi:hypothetical protein
MEVGLYFVNTDCYLFPNHLYSPPFSAFIGGKTQSKTKEKNQINLFFQNHIRGEFIR